MAYKITDVEFCFYHVERCGGSSIRKILYDFFIRHYDKKQIFLADKNDNINIIKKYYKYLINNKLLEGKKVILSHIDATDIIINSRYNVLNIRDSFDRAISHYYHFRYKNKKIEDLEPKILKEIFTNIGDTLELRTLNKPISWYKQNEIKKYYKSKFDFIIKLDNLNNDLCKLIKILNLKYNDNYKIKPVHINKTNTKFLCNMNLILNYISKDIYLEKIINDLYYENKI